jgi:hypothetical protein
VDAFEKVVAEILWAEGYWVRTSVRVDLTKEQKVRIGRPSSPRWELDVVAYRGRDNLLQVVECKSYLDSGGVSISAFNGSNERFAKCFKLFADHALRGEVLGSLCDQLAASGACAVTPKVQLGLACGKIASPASRAELRKFFDQQGWQLWDAEWLQDRLRAMASRGYENEVSAVVAKLLLRSKVSGAP